MVIYVYCVYARWLKEGTQLQKKGERILKLCDSIECATTVDEANNFMLELLGVVVGNSKYSYDIEKAVITFLKRSEGYSM